MRNDFPILQLAQPVTSVGRKRKASPPPLADGVIARRAEIAASLLEHIRPLSDSLAAMTDDQRRAVFYKLEHEATPPLGGTGLKPVVQSKRLTLAVPCEHDLRRLERKVEQFASGTPGKGHLPNDQLVTRLQAILEGDARDRLCQAFYDDYESLTAREWVTCEIELVSLAARPGQRRADLAEMRQCLAKAFRNGTAGNFFDHEEFGETCRAVIRCSGALLRQLVEAPEWRRRIWWFDERPAFRSLTEVATGFSVDRLGPVTGPDEAAPTVCVVDSGANPGNPFLKLVIRPGMLRSFLGDGDDPHDGYGHGSAVASLVSYYALNPSNGAVNRGQVWVAGARILDANGELDEREPRLFSTILRRVVDSFVPLGIRVFNLSVSVRNRNWNEEMKRTVPRTSWVARAIDKISREKDVLFITCTGNLSLDQIGRHMSSGSGYPQYLRDEEATLLDPGQAALALTVGSLAPSALVADPRGQLCAVALGDQPSPFSRRGPGMLGEIKPELVEYGGNLVRDVELQSIHRNIGTDVVVATRVVTPAVTGDAGTSLAAPRVAHTVAGILAELASLGVQVSAPLLKAFAVNSASRQALDGGFTSAVPQSDIELSYCLSGYGVPSAAGATHCDRHSVVLYYQGLLPHETVVYFDIPVPSCLARCGDGTKRLTVTIAYAPEVQRSGLERYLGTEIQWRLYRGDVDREMIVGYMSLEEDGPTNSAPPGRPTEMQGQIGIRRRSRGTVQHDVFEWKRHQESFSASHYTLALAAYDRWRRTRSDPVPYAVVIRLEDVSQTAPVYSEVENAISRVQVQVRS